MRSDEFDRIKSYLKSRELRRRMIPSNPDLIDRHTTARMLGVTVRTLHRWHMRGYGPVRREFTSNRHDVYYSRAEVEQWKADRSPKKG
jgi:hypothetical protein